MNDHISFLAAAISEAEKAAQAGDVPIGAVVVCNGSIVGRGHNTRECLNDPTGHAEINALRDAGQTLGRWRLDDCDLYVTHEPCPMCAGAMILSQIHRVCYGCREPLTGCCESRMNLLQFPGFPHNVRITGPLAQETCEALTREFFNKKRHHN